MGQWLPVQRRLHIMDETGCSLTKGVETFTAWFGQYLSEHYDLTGAHSETVTAEWQRCAEFIAQILPTCQQQAADNTKQTLNEFSAAFDACR